MGERLEMKVEIITRNQVLKILAEVVRKKDSLIDRELNRLRARVLELEERTKIIEAEHEP